MDNPPDVKLPLSTAFLSLEGKELEVLDHADAKVGSRVRIVLMGIVKRAESHAETRTDEAKTGGSVEIDITSIRIGSNSEIAELFEDDLNG